jgi:hypothetical protein
LFKAVFEEQEARVVQRRVDGELVRVDDAEAGVERREVVRLRLRPRYCRSYAKKKVAAALPLIAEAFLEEAKKGSIQHAKVLMQLSGLDVKENPKNARPRGKSLAGELLKELRKKPEEIEQE